MSLSKVEFQRWLQGQDTLLHGRCPLQHYLGGETWCGTETFTTPTGTSRLPKWAIKFIERLDEKLTWELEDYHAQDVLAILHDR